MSAERKRLENDSATDLPFEPIHSLKQRVGSEHNILHATAFLRARGILFYSRLYRPSQIFECLRKRISCADQRSQRLAVDVCSLEETSVQHW